MSFNFNLSETETGCGGLSCFCACLWKENNQLVGGLYVSPLMFTKAQAEIEIKIEPTVLTCVENDTIVKYPLRVW